MSKKKKVGSKKKRKKKNVRMYRRVDREDRAEEVEHGRERADGGGPRGLARAKQRRRRARATPDTERDGRGRGQRREHGRPQRGRVFVGRRLPQRPQHELRRPRLHLAVADDPTRQKGSDSDAAPADARGRVAEEVRQRDLEPEVARREEEEARERERADAPVDRERRLQREPFALVGPPKLPVEPDPRPRVRG